LNYLNKLYTTGEVAKIFGASYVAVKKWAYSGKIKYIKTPGGKYRYPESEIKAPRRSTIHPKYLDTQGLLALWREGLLAQKCLLGLTKGYLNHPQLIRFKRTTNPPLYIGTTYTTYT
jgi:excisionase family DNA binding protein